MIIITGGAGFIGSCLAAYLRRKGVGPIVIVDQFDRNDKLQNLNNIDRHIKVERSHFFDWLNRKNPELQCVFHLGARTDTVETDETVFQKLNVDYSKKLWQYCSEKRVPFIYASSAATYGNGANGYSDDHANLENLKPLNTYGRSKHQFDLWAIAQNEAPEYWYGLKFFNVYGPNEYHKGRMSSVPYKAYLQISNGEPLLLFRSHREGIADGQQKRDFVYVKDVLNVLWFFFANLPNNGIYNVGSGRAASFTDLADSLFSATNTRSNVKFVDIPEDIRENYQYFTEAEVNKLRTAGYEKSFANIREGVEDYVVNYLKLGYYY